MAAELSKKHLAFVDEFFLCGMNATEAYCRLYPKSSYDAARAHAARLVADGNVSAEIDRRLKEKQLSADEVLARLGDMARSDIADFADVRRMEDLQDGQYRGKTHVIKKFKRRVIHDSLGRQIEEIELELYPADGALEKIGKHHGLFTDKIEIKLEKEVDAILDTLETLLDADSYQRVLQALSTRSGDGQTGTGETTETEE